MYGGFAIASPPIAGYISKPICRSITCNFTITSIESIGMENTDRRMLTPTIKSMININNIIAKRNI